MVLSTGFGSHVINCSKRKKLSRHSIEFSCCIFFLCALCFFWYWHLQVLHWYCSRLSIGLVEPSSGEQHRSNLTKKYRLLWFSPLLCFYSILYFVGLHLLNYQSSTAVKKKLSLYLNLKKCSTQIIKLASIFEQFIYENDVSFVNFTGYIKINNLPVIMSVLGHWHGECRCETSFDIIHDYMVQYYSVSF